MPTRNNSESREGNGISKNKISKITAPIKMGVISVLMAFSLVACSPDTDKLKDKIIDDTELVEKELSTLKEMNKQYNALRLAIDKQSTKDPWDGKDLKKRREDIKKKTSKIGKLIDDIKNNRIKFTEAGGKIENLEKTTSFDEEIKKIEKEVKAIK